MNPFVAPRRRGVLLLVVLSMLTLFLMLGATYLVAATRARRVAKAYAAAASSQADTEAAATALLDEAFLTVVRGSTVASGSIRPADTLLGDRYGSQGPEKGRITGVTGNLVLAATVTGLGNAEKLPGRVLTFTMPDLAGASTRIIRAESSGGATTIYFSAGRTPAGTTLTAAAINQAVTNTPAAQTHILLNNREFDGTAGNEPYDAFDDQNNFLANLNASPASFSFAAATGDIDNDGDGTRDSGWLDIGLPPITDSAGNILQPKAAILVVDLDGRINANTHGTNVDLESTEGTGDFGGGGSVDYYPDELIRDPNDPTGNTITGTIRLHPLPRGLGTGPAEIDLGATSVAGTAAQALPALTGGMPVINTPDNAGAADSRPRPLIGHPEGRYGDAPLSSLTPAMLSIDAKPGTPSADDNRLIDQWVSSSTPANPLRYFDDNATRYGSPSDIKGRMRLWVDAFGQPIYFKPAWGATAGSPRGFADDDVIDDPYEIDLGPTGARNGWIHDPATFASGTSPARDNPFTATELEGLLRFYDPDSLRLPRRLVTLTGSSAVNGRRFVTTDSWDTPAIVGTHWNDVIAAQFAAATTSTSGTIEAKPYQLFSPETLMGHRLDLNRPFQRYDGYANQPWEPMDEDENSNGFLDGGEDRNANGAIDTAGELARQQFAKHLYCLLVAIARKNKNAALTPLQAEQLAQWAVNVVDFRDGDSVMTRFDYDESFTAGSTTWNPTKRVWGCERPEVIITETHAWHDRRTDDTASDPTGKEVIDADPSVADNDFDQQRRPRGAFFIELHSPWGSQAKQALSGTTPYDVHRSGTNTPRMRGEPLPGELIPAGTDRFDRSATVALSLRHDRTLDNSDTASGSPIWRLVTVRGDVQARGSGVFGSDGFGTDPGRPYVTGALSSGTSILDPARPRATSVSGTNPQTIGSGTAVIDRFFYFTPPPLAQRAEANGYGHRGCVFWESGTSTTEPSQRDFVVFGTDGLSPTNPSVTGTFSNVQRTFNRPLNRPATVSEPLATGTAATTTGTTSFDGYQILTGSAGTFASGTGIYDAAYVLPTPLDQPLDGRATHPAAVTEPFLDIDGNPLLMRNGRHANFAVVHLQRLADPTRPWQPNDAQPFYNPYLTVDSMPIDLTVVNTGTSGSTNGNFDEPGQTPQDADGNLLAGALDWLATQNSYDRWSVERGGKSADNNALERDIWNAKVNVDPAAGPLSVQSEGLFRSGTAAVRPIANYTPPPQPNPANQKASIAKTDLPNPLPSSSFAGRPERLQGNRRQPWLFWANRPFTSPAELAAVPRTSSFHLLKLHTTGTGLSTATPAFAHLTGLLESGSTQDPWNVVFSSTASGTSAPPSVFDFVHVPTRFGGSYLTVTATTAAVVSELQNHGLEAYAYNHFSLFREPGRINVNTTPDPTFKTALLGKQEMGTPPTWTSGTSANWIDLVKLVNPDFVDSSQPHRNVNLDAFFRYQTANRIANNATTRSNVFAVWVTVGYFPVGSTAEAQPIQRQRGFFIYDRSIPVGFEPGHDWNVRDGILLRRIIQ
jgi:hypothetical protein